MRYVVAFVLILSLAAAASATIRRVGPADSCQTIACAYSVANAGDTILISAGTYNESLTSVKRLTILGSGIDLTRINGQIILNNGSSATVLEGMSVRSNLALQISGQVDSVVVRRCRLDNTWDYAALYQSTQGSGRYYLDDCIFGGNPNGNPWGLIQLNGASVIARNCIFYEDCWCRSGGAIGGQPSSLTVQNCVFVGFPGGLFGMTGSFPFLFTNNIVYDFSGNWGTYPPNSTLDYNAFTGSVPQGHTANYVVLTQNPFQSYSPHAYVYGTSNLHLDPNNGLPCVNAGVPAIHDLDGSRSDLGVYGGQTPFIDSGSPAYPFVSSFNVPPAVTVGQNLPIQSQGRIGRGY